MCPQCHFRLRAFEFISNRKFSFSLCPSPLSCSFFPSFFFLFFLRVPLQPFMSPRYPGGPRPSLRMPNQVLNTLDQFYVAFKSLESPCCDQYASFYNEFPCLLSFQPPGGIPGSQPLLPNSLDPTRPQGEATEGWRFHRIRSFCTV